MERGKISILVFLDFNDFLVDVERETEGLFQSLFSWILTLLLTQLEYSIIIPIISILVFLDFNTSDRQSW